MNKKIEIYTKFGCGYCSRAKQLFSVKGADFIEYDVSLGGTLRAEMLERAPGAATVPQIFIDNALIGGCDDLFALDAQGRLDALLLGPDTQ
jgi:glutaredoxin 3